MAVAWGLLILVVFPLLQLPVLLYIARRVNSEESNDHPSTKQYWSDPTGDGPIRPPKYNASSPSKSSQAEYESSTETESVPSESDETVTHVCPHCGTENDPAYMFCRSCVEKLPPPMG